MLTPILLSNYAIAAGIYCAVKATNIFEEPDAESTALMAKMAAINEHESSCRRPPPVTRVGCEQEDDAVGRKRLQLI